MASRYAIDPSSQTQGSDRFGGNLRVSPSNGTTKGGFRRDDYGHGGYRPEGNTNGYPGYQSDGYSRREENGYRRDYSGGGRHSRESGGGGYYQEQGGHGGSRGYLPDRRSANWYPESGHGSHERESQQRGYGVYNDRDYWSGDRGGDRGRQRGGPGRDSRGQSKPKPYAPQNQERFHETIPQGVNFSKYQEQKVSLTGDDPPKCIHTFEDAQLSKTVKENVGKSNYKEMTPVQKYALPAITAGRDLMSCAETGSGKTSAFILPILSLMHRHSIYSDPSHSGVITPSTLILVPTRELAIQIYSEAQRFAFGSDIRCGLYYGGTSIEHQNRVLTKGCHVLVATPGRLLDCLHHGRILLNKIKFLVVDEADRLMDRGFLPEITDISSKFDMPVPGARQTLLFSATLPIEIQNLGDQLLCKDYLFLTVGKQGKPANTIKQVVMQVQGTDKLRRLIQLLKDCDGQKIIVFVESKRQTDLLASQVCQEHMQATSIHGSRMQQEREMALYDFMSGKRLILIATAVAGRGLDIKNVDHVINYDLPRDNFDEYVHRIGRTGRIGNNGLATSFYDPMQDSCIARKLVHALATSDQDVPAFLEEAANQAIGTDIPAMGRYGHQFGGTDRRPRYQNAPLTPPRDYPVDYGHGRFDSYHGQTHSPRGPQHSVHGSPRGPQDVTPKEGVWD